MKPHLFLSLLAAAAAVPIPRPPRRLGGGALTDTDAQTPAAGNGVLGLGLAELGAAGPGSLGRDGPLATQYYPGPSPQSSPGPSPQSSSQSSSRSSSSPSSHSSSVPSSPCQTSATTCDMWETATARDVCDGCDGIAGTAGDCHVYGGNHLTASECTAFCEAQGAGCCESRTTGPCSWKPDPHHSIGYSPPHGDTKAVLCTSMPSDCDANAFCTNTEGSYACTCNEGFFGNGITCTSNHPSSQPSPIPSQEPSPSSPLSSSEPSTQPTAECVPCGNTATSYMDRKGLTCFRDPSYFRNKCNNSHIWRTNKFCQRRCFEVGLAYGSDSCCPLPHACDVSCATDPPRWVSALGVANKCDVPECRDCPQCLTCVQGCYELDQASGKCAWENCAGCTDCVA